MNAPSNLLTPRIMIVDDERQIHASVRLRLGKTYDYVCHTDPREALAQLAEEKFDLCFADLHMPHMNGFRFIEAARERDPALSYVVISAFDTDENLRRTIPLQVCDFISKPLPEFDPFEDRVPDWIQSTRQRRLDQQLAANAERLSSDLANARLERDVEMVASESARETLLQTASLLTTVHAHLVSATTTLAQRKASDPSLAQLSRSIEEGRRAAEALVAISEGFFGSAYGNRDASPAFVDQGLRHAISIALRMTHGLEANKQVDLSPISDRLPIRGLTGIDFLLTFIPAIGAAISLAEPNTTIRVTGEIVPRLDGASRDPRFSRYLWINRRNASQSQPGVVISLACNGPSLSRSAIEAWIAGEHAPLSHIATRGLLKGIQQARGFLGFSQPDQTPSFNVLIALPA